jgi:hypothetical protein
LDACRIGIHAAIDYMEAFLVLAKHHRSTTAHIVASVCT